MERAAALFSGGLFGGGQGASGRGRFTDDEFRFDLNEIRDGFVGQFFEQELSCGTAHLLERLPDGSERRYLEGGGLDVVEADD